jgi:hypothetical protein
MATTKTTTVRHRTIRGDYSRTKLLRFFQRYNPRTFPLRRSTTMCPIAFAMGGRLDNMDAMQVDFPVVSAIDAAVVHGKWSGLSAKKIVDTIKAVNRLSKTGL